MAIRIPYNFPGAAGPALLSETASTKPLVILLHGLGGDSTDWTSPQKWRLHFDLSAPLPPNTTLGTFDYPAAGPAGRPLKDPLLPSITTFDQFLNDNGFQTLNYDQITPRGTLAAPALELAALMRTLHAHPVLVERSFVLLCHSRGGLLVRKFLKDNRNDPAVVGRIIKVVTLCSPHAGSAWGNVVTAPGQPTITMAAAFDALINLHSPGAGPVVTSLLSPLISFTTTPAYLEMRVGGPFITDLASGEEPLPGVEYHTFGGTSVTFSRLIDRVYTRASAIPALNGRFTHVVTSAVDPARSPVFSAYPQVNASAETAPGRGDFLVSEVSSRLSFANSHHVHPVNHAEVMWDRNVHRQVLNLLRGADVWAGWTTHRGGAVGADANLSLVRDEFDRLLLFAGHSFSRRWRRELAVGDPTPPGLPTVITGESPGWTNWANIDPEGRRGFAAEFDSRRRAGSNQIVHTLHVFAAGRPSDAPDDAAAEFLPPTSNIWVRRRVGLPDNWSTWADLGGTRYGPSDLSTGLTAVYSTLKGDVQVVRNDRGELELFAAGTGDRLWTARQNSQGPSGSFTAWEQLPIPAENVAAAVLDDDGALLVFVYKPGAGMKLDCYRRPPGGVWAQWALPAQPGLILSLAIRDAENKLVLLARGADGLMYWTRLRVPRPGRFRDDGLARGSRSGILAGVVALLLLPFRFIISLFAGAGPLRVENKWEPWMAEDGAFAGDLSAELNIDGSLAVVARGEDGRVLLRGQSALLGDWTPWQSLHGDTRVNPVIGRLASGRLAVLAISTEGNIHQRTQTAPGLW